MNLQNLSAENFEEIFDEMVSGNFGEEKTKEFLLELNAANLPQNSFIGATSALRKRMKKINAPQNSIDVCGTGGDRLNTLNISTAVCFVVAASGVVVAKHGNKAISSQSGSADIFSELGIKISSDINEIEQNLRQKNLCFLFAPFFHEALKNVALIRKSLAIPTIFNFLGPLLNPANTSCQLIGTSRHDVMAKMLSTLSQSKKVFIVHGFDKMDEITLCDKSYLLRMENGKVFDEEIVDPKSFGFERINIDDIRGQDPKYNAEQLVKLLSDEKSEKLSSYRNIVVLNAAFALKVADKVSKIEDGIDFAKDLISSGKALKVLESLRQN